MGHSDTQNQCITFNGSAKNPKLYIISVTLFLYHRNSLYIQPDAEISAITLQKSSAVFHNLSVFSGIQSDNTYPVFFL